MFQIATASAIAWDHGQEATFPDLWNFPEVYNHVFFRCKREKCRVDFVWQEPLYSYTPIPFQSNMALIGYFQSEKYFAHHRARLTQLFSPHPTDLEYILTKYSWLLDHPQTVGIQLRYYKSEFPDTDMYPQYGRKYFEKAMSLFPKNSLFIVSSNNLAYARTHIPTENKEVVFLEGEPYYIDFYLLSFCHHNIITNSSFGWWSAYLNDYPNKIVVAPLVWVNGLPAQDVCPQEWIRIEADYE